MINKLSLRDYHILETAEHLIAQRRELTGTPDMKMFMNRHLTCSQEWLKKQRPFHDVHYQMEVRFL